MQAASVFPKKAFPTSKDISPNSQRTWRHHFLALLCFVCIALASFYGLAWQNQFPAQYHPDEPQKIAHVESNYDVRMTHPLLMINATRLLLWTTQSNWSPHDMITAGRTTSALFIVASMLIFITLAYIYNGLWAGLAVGIPMAFSTILLHAAHVMKEDAALVFGIGLVFMAARWLTSTITLKRLCVFALACGLAASAKYPGLVFFPLGLGWLWWLKLKHSISLSYKQITLCFMGMFGLTWLIANYQIIYNLPALVNGFLFEAKHIVTAHNGLVRHNVGGLYLKKFQQEQPWPLQVLMGFYVLWFWVRFKTTTMAERLEMGFFLVYVFVTANAKIFSPRYFVPIEAISYYFEGKGAILLLSALKQPRWAQAFILAGLIGFCVWFKFPYYQKALLGYGNDNRQNLVHWVTNHIPLQARIASESTLCLPDMLKEGAKTPFQKRIIISKFTADLGPIAQLCQQDIRYVIVSKSQSARLFDQKQTPAQAEQERYQARRAFYQTLFSQATLLWQGKKGGNQLMPDLQLYHLTDSACKTNP